MEQRRRLVAVGALTAIVAAGSIRTFLRNRDWKDNFTLFTAAVAAYPQSVKAQTFLGWEYLRRNDVARAEEHLLAAERIYPDYPLLQQDLGSLEFRKGDLPAAERHFEIALRASAGYSVEPEMLISYAALELQAGRYDKALALLNSAIRSWPGISRAYSNRAVVFYRMNRNDLARADVEMALRLNPGNLQASTLLGRL
jgi:tetratricopeptide (TPR) repeat protein